MDVTAEPKTLIEWYEQTMASIFRGTEVPERVQHVSCALFAAGATAAIGKPLPVHLREFVELAAKYGGPGAIT